MGDNLEASGIVSICGLLSMDTFCSWLVSRYKVHLVLISNVNICAPLQIRILKLLRLLFSPCWPLPSHFMADNEKWCGCPLFPLLCDLMLRRVLLVPFHTLYLPLPLLSSVLCCQWAGAGDAPRTLECYTVLQACPQLSQDI